jgi:protein arginine N-methyltransferase 7
MNVFTIKVNPVTGKSEWELQNEDYDYHQEIARSAFADMLHDTERVRHAQTLLISECRHRPSA